MASLSGSSIAKRRRRKRQSGPDVTGPPKQCSACNIFLPQPRFSKSQLFKAATKRRCLSCMASGSGPAAGHLPCKSACSHVDSRVIFTRHLPAKFRYLIFHLVYLPMTNILAIFLRHKIINWNI
eukprot:SAG11_NODE_197_length_12691_cov_20.904145_1_plen_124_part_00